MDDLPELSEKENAILRALSLQIAQSNLALRSLAYAFMSQPGFDRPAFLEVLNGQIAVLGPNDAIARNVLVTVVASAEGYR